MKLVLGAQEGIAILTGTGEVSDHDLKVLRAGLKKLLLSGRNRVVLELTEADQLPPEIVREISKFDALARELAGRIVLAGNNERLREQVKRFALPPIIDCFDGREAAIAYLREKAAPDTALPETTTKPDYKAEIRKKELDGLTELRARVSQLENENRLLTEQLLTAVAARRSPPSAAAQQAQIEALEQKIEELLNGFKAGQNPSK